MTCIAGLIDGGKVYIGGDSAASDEVATIVRQDEKVFHVGPYLIGVCDSFRVAQLLRYSFDPPRFDGGDLFRFMVVGFINGVRKLLADGGVAKIDSNVEEGGDFLVGFQGRLFHVGSDFQVGESADGYDACGSGTVAALASLYSTGKLSPKRRLIVALEAAEKLHSGEVRRPFRILSTRAAA